MTVTDVVEKEARLTLSLSKSSRPLNAAERAIVEEQISHLIAERNALRATPLENGDQPTPWLDPTPATILQEVRHGE